MTQTESERPARPPSEEEGAPAGSKSGSTRVLGPGSLAGTLCSDPSMRYVGNGKALVKLRIAVTARVREGDGGRWRDGETEFIDLSVWGKQGENVMESLRQGDRVVVNGIWQESTWLGRDEQWHSSKSLTVRDIGPSLMFRQARVVGRKEERE